MVSNYMKLRPESGKDSINMLKEKGNLYKIAPKSELKLLPLALGFLSQTKILVNSWNSSGF